MFLSSHLLTPWSKTIRFPDRRNMKTHIHVNTTYGRIFVKLDIHNSCILQAYIWATWSEGAEISMLLISNSTTKELNRVLMVSKCKGFKRFPLKIKFCSIGWQHLSSFSLWLWISCAHLTISSILIQLYLKQTKNVFLKQDVQVSLSIITRV